MDPVGQSATQIPPYNKYGVTQDRQSIEEGDTHEKQEISQVDPKISTFGFSANHNFVSTILSDPGSVN